MINLNGSWDYILDKKSEYSIDYIKNLISRNKVSGSIKVPSNWNSGKLTNFSGTLWYVKKIKIQKNNSWKRLLFAGVDYFTDVWFNWNYLGSHEGYFQSFDFGIDDSLIEYNTTNILVVKVSSPIETPGKIWPHNKKLIKGIFNHHDCRPGGWNEKYGQDRNTGGIWNNVKIIFEKKIIITETKISSKLVSNKAELKISFKYKSRLDSETIALTKISVKSKNRKLKTFISKSTYLPNSGTASIIITLPKPELWFPYDLGEPVITTIRISSELFNEVIIKYGIREVNLNEKKEFFINNKRLFLRGTNIIPEQYLSNLTQTKINNLVTLLKKANINIVRVHAHINRHELYEAFDEAGILVWQDFALQWTYEESNEFKINAIKQIKDMVNQFYNHPSIVFWCCHNEPGEQIETLDKYLYQAVVEEDSTRIVRLASNYEEHAYEGWYWGTVDDYISTPRGPLVTEFGAQALPNYNSLKKILSTNDIKNLNWDKWEYHNFQYEQTFNVAGIRLGKNINEFITSSQKYQAKLIEKAVDYYRRKKWNGITGIFQFMFVDGWESISWSVIDYFGKKKPGYYALQHVFRPIYVSINLKKKRYQVGEELFLELWIINDLYVQHKNSKIIIYLNSKKLITIGNITIKEDSVFYLSSNETKVKIPNAKNLSELKVIVVNSAGKVLTKNKAEIKVYKTKIKW